MQIGGTYICEEYIEHLAHSISLDSSATYYSSTSPHTDGGYCPYSPPESGNEVGPAHPLRLTALPFHLSANTVSSPPFTRSLASCMSRRWDSHLEARLPSALESSSGVSHQLERDSAGIVKEGRRKWGGGVRMPNVGEREEATEREG